MPEFLDLSLYDSFMSINTKLKANFPAEIDEEWNLLGINIAFQKNCTASSNFGKSYLELATKRLNQYKKSHIGFLEQHEELLTSLDQLDQKITNSIFMINHP